MIMDSPSFDGRIIRAYSHPDWRRRLGLRFSPQKIGPAVSKRLRSAVAGCRDSSDVTVHPTVVRAWSVDAGTDTNRADRTRGSRTPALRAADRSAPGAAMFGFGALLATDPAVSNAILRAAAICLAVYVAHLKDDYVDYYVRGEDDANPLKLSDLRVAIGAAAGCSRALSSRRPSRSGWLTYSSARCTSSSPRCSSRFASTAGGDRREPGLTRFPFTDSEREGVS